MQYEAQLYCITVLTCHSVINVFCALLYVHLYTNTYTYVHICVSTTFVTPAVTFAVTHVFTLVVMLVTIVTLAVTLLSHFCLCRTPQWRTCAIPFPTGCILQCAMREWSLQVSAQTEEGERDGKQEGRGRIEVRCRKGKKREVSIVVGKHNSAHVNDVCLVS